MTILEINDRRSVCCGFKGILICALRIQRIIAAGIIADTNDLCFYSVARRKTCDNRTRAILYHLCDLQHRACGLSIICGLLRNSVRAGQSHRIRRLAVIHGIAIDAYPFLRTDLAYSAHVDEFSRGININLGFNIVDLDANALDIRGILVILLYYRDDLFGYACVVRKAFPIIKICSRVYEYVSLGVLILVAVDSVYLATVRRNKSFAEAGYCLYALTSARYVVLVHIDKVRKSLLRNERVIARKVYTAKVAVVAAQLASVTFNHFVTIRS